MASPNLVMTAEVYIMEISEVYRMAVLEAPGIPSRWCSDVMDFNVVACPAGKRYIKDVDNVYIPLNTWILNGFNLEVFCSLHSLIIITREQLLPCLLCAQLLSAIRMDALRVTMNSKWHILLAFTTLC